MLVGVAARNAHPGLEVHVANDGAEGIAYLSGIAALADPPEHPTPDLVLLDLMMPNVDGFGVLEWIREKLGQPTFPVVVFTGSTEPEYETRARELGATDFCMKPTDPGIVLATVREIVTRWIPPGDIIASHLRELG